MKLKEILKLVDTMVENSIPAATKILWINLIMNEFYRDYPLPEKFSTFTVRPGQELYKLPDDCPQDRIVALTVDNVPYGYIPSDLSSDITPARFCTIIAEMLMIHPVLPIPQKAILRYKPSPKQLTEEDLEKTPDFPSDFQEMLVMGCAARVAKSKPETVSLATTFDNDFYVLSERASRVLIRPRQRKVISTRTWQ